LESGNLDVGGVKESRSRTPRPTEEELLIAKLDQDVADALACAGSVPFSSLSMIRCPSGSAVRIRPLSQLGGRRGHHGLHCRQHGTTPDWRVTGRCRWPSLRRSPWPCARRHLDERGW